jgi:hypothetical protein
MFNYQLSLSANSIDVSGYAPATITFQPSAYTSTDVVYTIVYNFNNTDQHRIIYTEFPLDLNIPTIHPTGITVDHFIESVGTYTGTISVFKLGNNIPDVITYSISLSAPDIFELNLLKSSMTNTYNDLLYVFESKHPQLIAPVKINWPEKKLTEPTTIEANNISYIRVIGSLNSASDLDAYLDTGLSTGDAFQIDNDLYVYNAATRSFSNIGRSTYKLPDYFFVLSDEDFIPLLTEEGNYIAIY